MSDARLQPPDRILFKCGAQSCEDMQKYYDLVVEEIVELKDERIKSDKEWADIVIGYKFKVAKLERSLTALDKLELTVEEIKAILLTEVNKFLYATGVGYDLQQAEAQSIYEAQQKKKNKITLDNKE